MPDNPKPFDCYSVGICYASVCSSLTPEETEARMNTEQPSGTTHGWKLARDATFKAGAPNPCPCHDHPETHKHYLLEC